MFDMIYLKNKLKQTLSDARYRHSENVYVTAIMLAAQHGVDVDKAGVAALLHDCARGMRTQELVAYCSKYSICLTELERQQPGLIHAKAGAHLVQHMYNVEDAEIIKAILLHTTGGAAMSALDKVIYLADMTEPDRNFVGVEALRTAAGHSLEQAMLMAFNYTIAYLVDSGMLIHPGVIEGRNDLLMR